MADGQDLLGDGVNIAARLEGVAAPGGICISGSVREQIDGKLNFTLTPLGERSLKNIPRPIQVYSVDWRAEDPITSGVLGGSLALPDKPSIAVLPFANMSGDPEQEYFAMEIRKTSSRRFRTIVGSLSSHGTQLSFTRAALLM